MKNPKQKRRVQAIAFEIVDDPFMGGWTMQRVRADTKRLLATIQKLLADKPKAGTLNGDLRRALLDVIHDIEVAEITFIDGFSMTDEKAKLEAAQAAMERAFQAGLKFTAVKSRYEFHKSKGKTESPVWKYIRKVKKANPSWKPSEIISEAETLYKRETGDAKFSSGKKLASLIAHFREMA